MSDLNYTRGEWKVLVNPEYLREPASSIPIYTGNGQMILSCNGIAGRGEMLANAYLTAAAPEMYEALKAIISQTSWMGNEDYPALQIEHSIETVNAITKAEIALAKANGK